MVVMLVGVGVEGGGGVGGVPGQGEVVVLLKAVVVWW